LKAARERRYDDESIKALKGPDKVRLRPSVIFGSDGIEGCEHSFFEILSNSVDEAREGYGDRIEITRHADRSITVRDYASGIPLDYNQAEERYNWELIYCELYAGGKYDNADGGSYEFSLGINGLGCCATQFSSEWFDVVSWRNGTEYTLHFEKGHNIGGLGKRRCDKALTGTLTRWKPDREVFTEIDIGPEYYADTLRRQAIVNPGLRFAFNDEVTGEASEYHYAEGIKDYVGEVAGAGAPGRVRYFEGRAQGRDREDKPEYKVRMQLAFCISDEGSLTEYYHNSSFLLHGGAPDKAVRAAFTQEVDKALRNSGRYAKDEAKVTFSDIQECLVIVTSSFSNVTSYENQTKKAISNRFIQEAMTEFIRQNLEVYLIEEKDEAETLQSRALASKRGREAAERAKLNIKKKVIGNTDSFNKVEKFVDCRTKEIDRRELYIVEGDSALGSCKLGRDAEFQAIMPVRGKPLNCMKTEVGRIFKNEVIMDIIKVLGCGVEYGARGAKDAGLFDIERLRWGKVIICTDADYDGFQIRTLILAMLYRLVPELILKGKVYIAETPLYEITAKGAIRFAYDEAEKEEIVRGAKGRCTIQRSKGLGENEPDMMWETTMCPETRRLIRIGQADAERTAETFDVLLGNNLAERKGYIERNGGKYMGKALEEVM